MVKIFLSFGVILVQVDLNGVIVFYCYVEENVELLFVILWEYDVVGIKMVINYISMCDQYLIVEMVFGVVIKKGNFFLIF